MRIQWRSYDRWYVFSICACRSLRRLATCYLPLLLRSQESGAPGKLLFLEQSPNTIRTKYYFVWIIYCSEYLFMHNLVVSITPLIWICVKTQCRAQCSAAQYIDALFLSHESYLRLLSNDKIEFVTQKKRNAVQRRSALINIRYKRINYSHNDFVQQQQ